MRCRSDKIVYLSEEKALAAVARRNAQPAPAGGTNQLFWSHYRCSFCVGWHISCSGKPHLGPGFGKRLRQLRAEAIAKGDASEAGEPGPRSEAIDLFEGEPAPSEGSIPEITGEALVRGQRP